MTVEEYNFYKYTIKGQAAHILEFLNRHDTSNL